MIQLVTESLADTWGIVPRVLIIMFVSLYASQVLIGFGLFRRLGFIGRPLVRVAHLPMEAGVTFIASFGSVLAGNSMIAALYHKKHIDKVQTLLTAMLNTTPVYVKETFTYQIPVMIPLLGMKVGLLYFLTFVVSGLSRIVFVIVCGRMTLKREPPKMVANRLDSGDVGVKGKREPLGTLLLSCLSQQKRVFLRVAIIFVSTTFLIFLLINSGVVNGLVAYVGPLTRIFGLPASCAIPVSTYMFSPLIGAASIGAMLKDGGLTDLQGIVACVLGSLLMLPIFALRYSFAKYISIFGLSLGCTILAVSTLLGMVTRGGLLLLFMGMD